VTLCVFADNRTSSRQKGHTPPAPAHPDREQTTKRIPACDLVSINRITRRATARGQSLPSGVFECPLSLRPFSLSDTPLSFFVRPPVHLHSRSHGHRHMHLRWDFHFTPFSVVALTPKRALALQPTLTIALTPALGPALALARAPAISFYRGKVSHIAHCPWSIVYLRVFFVALKSGASTTSASAPCLTHCVAFLNGSVQRYAFTHHQRHCPVFPFLDLSSVFGDLPFPSFLSALYFGVVSCHPVCLCELLSTCVHSTASSFLCDCLVFGFWGYT
jgi:hypothetical protein